MNTTAKATGSTQGEWPEPCLELRTYRVAAPRRRRRSAPTQAPRPSTSRTKPRMKASRPETASTARTTRSTQVIKPPRTPADLIERNTPVAKPRSCGTRVRFAKSRDEVGDVADFVSRRPSGGAGGRPPRATRRGSVAGSKPSFAASFSRALGLRDLADLAGQADLAEIHHAGIGRRVGRGRGQRRRHREVGRRLADPQAAGDVEIDVGAR